MNKLFFSLLLCITANSFAMQRSGIACGRLCLLQLQRVAYSSDKKALQTEIESLERQVDKITKVAVLYSKADQHVQISANNWLDALSCVRDHINEITTRYSGHPDYHKCVINGLQRLINESDPFMKRAKEEGLDWTENTIEASMLGALDALRKETEKHSKVLALGTKKYEERDVLRAIEIFLNGSCDDRSVLRLAIKNAQASLERGLETTQSLEDAINKGREALKCLEVNTRGCSKKD